MSLRARLLAAVGIIALVALVVADVVTYRALESFLIHQVDVQLDAAARDYSPRFDGTGNLVCPDYRVGALLPMANPAPAAEPGGMAEPGEGNHAGPPPGSSLLSSAVVVRDPHGAVRLSCPVTVGGRSYAPAVPLSRRPPGPEPQPEPEPFPAHDGTHFEAPSTPAGGPEFRVRLSWTQHFTEMPSPAGPVDTLAVARPLTEVESTLHRLLIIELIVTAGAILAALAGGWWLVRLGLRPLDAIERSAEAIAAGDLTERVPGEGGRTEVGRLATTLNMMLARIEEAFAARVASEQRLRASDARLRRFVADASHELRTPIAAVAAYAELFGRGAADQEADLERVMAGISSETSRMEHLVADLLLLARLDEGRALQATSVDLVALCAEAVQTAGTVGPAWPVTFHASRPLEIEGDPLALRQVVDNLLGNVRSHTPEGTTVQVSVEPEVGEAGDGADGAVLTVADTGPGMDPEVAAHVFERFYRSDPSRSRLHGGAGLGLSIVEAIVTAHGGRAEVTSAPGAGTTVTVHLPARPPEVPTTEAGSPPGDGAG